MFEVIVLGATFAAAGIAQTCQKSCLILECSTRAGNEFFGALNFGKNYEAPVCKDAAVQLQKKLLDSGLYGGERNLYPYFQNTNILFQTAVVSVKSVDGHFVCLTHGIDGYASFEAKRVIDTRSRDSLCCSKTYNLLVESLEIPLFPGVTTEKAPGNNRYILRCAVPADCSYQEARKTAFGVMQNFAEDQKLILSADVFDYKIKEGYPKNEEGILYLPSKAFDNPALAFQAGLEVAV